MIEVKLGRRTINLPYTIRLFGVIDEMFDELVDEETKADLIDGVMIVRSPAAPPGSEIAEFLRTLTCAYVEERRLGVVLDSHTRVRIQLGRWVDPDVAYLTQSPTPKKRPKEYEGVPDLILEVLPPYGRGKELDEKRRVYQDAGTKEIWIVDAKKHQVIVDRWQRKRYETATIRTGPARSAILSGYWLDPEWLWSDPLPDVLPCLRKLLN